MNGLRFNRGNLLKVAAIFFPMVASVAFTAAKTQMGQGFPTPQAAVSAQTQAVNSHNVSMLHQIFGPGIEDLKNPDRVQATNEIEGFAADLNTTNALVRRADNSFELDVGADAWPFPVPIVKKEGQWFFDTEAGEQELLNRRIGRNELDVLKGLRGYVDAQREYASKDRMGDEVLQYAQRIASTPGKKDGLYWPAATNEPASPFGPLVAEAHVEGYGTNHDAGPHPFHGYLFRILTAQGNAAPDGKIDYMSEGVLAGGFALVAYPEHWDQSGIMTFIVNQEGKVYQQNLGKSTSRIAGAMKEYNPDNQWTLVPDEGVVSAISEK